MTGQSSRYFTLINLNSPTAYDEIAEALTELGLSPDSADDNGVTMLLCAMRRRNFNHLQIWAMRSGLNCTHWRQQAKEKLERLGAILAELYI